MYSKPKVPMPPDNRARFSKPKVPMPPDNRARFSKPKVPMPPDNRQVRQRLANGNIIEGVIYGGKEVGCSGGCEYREKRRGLFNDIKYKGRCLPKNNGCFCGALECTSSGRYSAPSRPSQTLINRSGFTNRYKNIHTINRNIYNL